MSTRYFTLGHFGKAMELVSKSLAIALAEGDMVLQCSSYCGMGQIHGGLGQFDEALECHVKHLAIASDMGDKFEQGKAHCGMSRYELLLELDPDPARRRRGVLWT